MPLVERQRVAAYGLARSEDSVLLVRASALTDGVHLWWLPGGGVHFGESPQDGLTREFAEEAGLRLQSSRLRDVVSDVAPLAAESVLLHSIRLVYDVVVDSGTPVAERDGSTDAVAWIDSSQLRDMALAPWLRSYFSGGRASFEPA